MASSKIGENITINFRYTENREEKKKDKQLENFGNRKKTCQFQPKIIIKLNAKHTQSRQKIFQQKNKRNKHTEFKNFP